jgi:1-phosphatidylinositol-3-phosphate 5-kinase
MPSTSQKPLPSIPRRLDVPRNLTSLTVDGREHLRKIIESCLAEIDQTALPDGGRRSWSKALEHSLGDLGANIAKGGWLTGVKRSRMARKAKRAEEMRKAEALMAMKESDEIGKSKGKGKDDLVQEAPRREDKELPKDPQGSPISHTDSLSLALQQICDIAARPMLPTPKPSAKHLLLCLAPIGRDIPVEDSGFDLVPHSASCAFTPRVFSLPEALSNDDESGILFGLNEWDGMYYALNYDIT